MVYIFGHKKPDTDSVCSAIALSFLKNSLGMKSTPRILDEVNNETKFVLNYFGVKSPRILNDVKLRIKNIDYNKDFYLNEDLSLSDAYKIMVENSVTSVPIVDDGKTIKGFISMKDIAKINFDFDSKLNTSYDNIIRVLNGEALLHFDDLIIGNTLVASYKSTTLIESVNIDNNSILIIGDRHSVIEHAVLNKAKIIILTGNSNIKEEHLNIAALNKVNIIKTPFDTYKVSRMIHFTNFVSSNNLEEIVLINENMTVNEFKTISTKEKYSSYPVVDDSMKCLGLILISDLANKTPIQVVMVDHNELSQSVEGIEEADIIEVVDHHKIGDIASKVPINFRNMVVGSTCTIIYKMFKESNFIPPKEVMGLLMSGIVSDTMLLNSPTTTNLDIMTLKEISNIINIDYEVYAKEMFHHGSSLEGKTLEEIIYTDFKNFVYNDKKIGIGQLITTSIHDVRDRFEDFEIELSKIEKNGKYDVIAFFITDILLKKSYIICGKDSVETIASAFKIENFTIGYCLKEIVSRKTQIMPAIIDYLDSI